MNYYAIPGLPRKPTVMKNKRPTVSISDKREKIIKSVMSFYGVSRCDIFKKSHKRPICRPRQIVMYLMHKMLNDGWTDISVFFEKDHTTVMRAVDTIKNLIDTEDSFRNEIILIEENV
jgi:chromosomal replication initiator protein